MIRWFAQGMMRWGSNMDNWLDERERQKRRKQRALNKDEDECVAEDSGGRRSAYDLVGSKKWAMEDSQFSNLFNKDGEVKLYTREFEYAEVAMFNAHVFCAQTGVDIKNIAIVFKNVMSVPCNYRDDPEYQHTKGRLIFDEPTLQKFNEWMDEYKTRFPEGFEFKQCLPVVNDGEEIKGRFVIHECDFDTRRHHQLHEGKKLYLPDDDLFDEWLWMLNNTSGQVRILNSMWVFEDASDAMMYQLQMR